MPEPTGQTTHPSLLNEIVSGDVSSRSWPIFVDKYGPILYRWCQRWGANPQDAEDVVQECLIVVFRKLDTYTNAPRSNFRSWLKTIAYRIWLQALEVSERKLQNGGHISSFGVTDLDLLRSKAARDDLTNRFDEMADQEILELASAKVRKIVDPLTWRCFELLNYQGISGHCAANQLKIKVGAVFTNACRVRKLLREEVTRLESQ